MKVSTKTKYGLRAITTIAQNYGKGPIPLKLIAEKQDISLKYLEQIIAILRTNGIVRSLRGAKGGYMLAKSPEKIKLLDCFEALEGSTSLVECTDIDYFCPRVNKCLTKILWTKIQNAVQKILDSTTVQDLIEQDKDSAPPDYHI